MPIRIISVSKSNSAGANAVTEEWLGKVRRAAMQEGGGQGGGRARRFHLCDGAVPCPSLPHPSTTAPPLLPLHRRYTSVDLVTLKPNPLKAKDVEVAKQAEAAKVC